MNSYSNTANKVVNDIFMDKSFLEKLPKGWNYSRARSYLVKVKNNPEKYQEDEVFRAYKLAEYLSKFYSRYHWVITKQEPDGLLSVDRYNTMTALSFHLHFICQMKKAGYEI